MFWFTFNFAVADFRPKMALTLEILSDQMHTLPRNSAVHKIFLFVASFRRSESAFCHLLCEATCSLRTFNHTFYEANFKAKLFTANVECNGTVIVLPKTEKPIRFLNFKFSLNGGDPVFWFTFNFAVADFRPKMALTLEILSDQMHTLPRNSAVHKIFLFVASFRRSESAFCHLLCEATCSLRTDKQLGNNVTSVDEFSQRSS